MNTRKTIFPLLLLMVLLYACGDSTPEETQQNIPLTGNPAIDGLTEALQSEPRNADLYAKRGKAFYDNKGYDEAIVDLTYAIQLDSTQPAYYHDLSDVYLDYFKSRQALQVIQEAAVLFPSDIPTLLRQSDLQLILKQNEESMKTIDQVLKLDPQNAMAYFMFGMNFKETGDTVRAINSFQKAVEFDADLVDAWINLGQLYEAIDDPLALRYLDNAVRIAPDDPLVWHAKANYLSNQGNLEEAIDTYRRLIGIDPQYEEAYFNSGLIYLDMDSLAQAMQQFDLTIKTSPTYIKAYYYRGLTHEMMGQIEAARTDYDQALRMAPDYNKAKAGLVRLSQVPAEEGE